MRTPYHKLIRDRIPTIIQEHGGDCGTERMDEMAYQQALRAKLVEEAQEAATAASDDLVTELADLYEVMDALLNAAGITSQQVLAEQAQRRAERGGFTQRLRLLWTE